MSNIPIRDITATGTPTSSSEIVFDDGQMKRAPVSSLADAVRPIASQSEAQVGTNNTKTMTPLRVKESFAAEIGVTIQGYSANLAGYAGKTVPSGAVVGTTDAQTLTNKTITSPLGIVKGDVGLGNVDNTSDLNKPVSTATQTALDLKIGVPTGGLTGQTLQKASNTNYDILWGSPLGGGDMLSSVYDPDGIGAFMFATVATLGTATLPAAAKQVRVQGYYTANDGGDGWWEKKVSEPAHVAKIQSADGAWWQPFAEPFLSVLQCGAKRDWQIIARTGTDNAPYFQAAFDLAKAAANAAGRGGGTVTIPIGSFGFATTVTIGEAMKIFGAGRGVTGLYRTTDYGDTFTVEPGAYARQFEMHNLEMIHSIPYDRTTNANMPDKATTGAHVRISGAQQCMITNCNFQRMPYCIYFVGGDNVILDNCIFYGVWDDENSSNQEGIAQVFVDTNAPLGLTGPTNWDVTRCYFAGQASNTRTLAWTPSSGTVTRSYGRSIGSRYGLLMRGIENGSFHSNHFGGLSTAEIAFICNDGSPLLDVRIKNNFFDGSSHGYGVFIEPHPAATTHAGLDIKIESNVFIDQRNGICVNRNVSGGPSIFGLKISDNEMRNMIGGAISLGGVKGFVVSNNKINSYNRFNLSTTDPTYCCGILTHDVTSDGEIFDNSIGGSVNYGLAPASISTSYPNAEDNYCWYDILNYVGGVYNYDNQSIRTTTRKAPVVYTGMR